MSELYPPGLNHAGLHVSTGDMPLTDKEITFASIVVALTTALASQIAAEISIISTAETGEAMGVQITATQSGAGGALAALDVTAIGNIDAAGNIHGFNVLASVAAGVGIAGRMIGGFILMNDGAGSSIASDAYGLWIMSMLNETVTGDHGILRLEVNCLEKAKMIIDVAGSNAEYFLGFHQVSPDGWQNTGDKTSGDSLGARGWLHVDLAGLDRYIQLYGPTP